MNGDVITDEAKAIRDYIVEKWGHLFDVQLEVKLNELFPEPENVGLKHIWKYGSADIVVSRKGNLVAIIETGGSHHWEEKQSLNDRRKWKLADINNVKCLTMMNGIMDSLSRRQWRNLLGQILFRPYDKERDTSVGAKQSPALGRDMQYSINKS